MREIIYSARHMLFPYWEWPTICGICSSFSSPPFILNLTYKIRTLTDSETGVGTHSIYIAIESEKATHGSFKRGCEHRAQGFPNKEITYVMHKKYFTHSHYTRKVV